MLVNRKSQIAMEFFMLIGFIFIFSIGFIYVFGLQLKDYSDRKTIETVNDFGESLKKEIDITSVVKEGYERKINLPEQIDGSINYSVSIISKTLILNTEIREFNYILPATKGSFQKGDNLLKNINKTVVIENV